MKTINSGDHKLEQNKGEITKKTFIQNLFINTVLKIIVRLLAPYNDK